jgi:hypothetical protein
MPSTTAVSDDTVRSAGHTALQKKNVSVQADLLLPLLAVTANLPLRDDDQAREKGTFKERDTYRPLVEHAIYCTFFALQYSKL